MEALAPEPQQEPYYVCHEQYYEHLMGLLRTMEPFMDTCLVLGTSGELASTHGLLLAALSGCLAGLPRPPSLRSMSYLLLRELDPWGVRSLLEYFYCGALSLPKHTLACINQILQALDVNLGNEFFESEDTVHFSLSHTMKFNIINKIWQNRTQNFDVKIMSEGMHESYAHSAILAACSDQLFTLLHAQGTNCKPSLIVLLDFQYEDIETVLKFCYRGEIEIQRGRISQICELAKILGIKGLYNTISNLTHEKNLPEENNVNKPRLKMSCWEHNETTKKIFTTLFEKESLSDIQLICSNHTFKVHSAVLNISPYFKAIFEVSEWRHCLVFLSRLSLEIVQAFVDYMYYGEVVFPGGPHAFALAMEGLVDFSVLPLNRVEPEWVEPPPLLPQEQPPQEHLHKEDFIPAETAPPTALPAYDGADPLTNFPEVPVDIPQLHPEMIDASINCLKPCEPVPKEEVPITKPLTYTCDTCLTVFYSRRSLKLHINSHPESSSVKCQYCEQVFTKPNLRKAHELTHTNTFICSTCGRSYSSQAGLRKHARSSHRASGPESFECAICGRSCSRKDYLEEHMRTHTGTKPFRCSTCGKKFVGRTGLNHHLKVHKPPNRDSVCEVCGKAFTRKALWTHMKTHDKQFMCTTCSKFFSTPGSLKAHMAMTHLEVKSYPCDVCTKSFAMQSHLNRHKKNVHNPTREYPCDKCPTVLVSETKLRQHERAAHETPGSRSYECETCGKRFNSHRSFTYHKMNHRGERPHACEFCEKTFVRRDALQKHVRSHTRERPYQCGLCEQKCCSKSALNKHVLRHHGAKPPPRAPLRLQPEGQVLEVLVPQEPVVLQEAALHELQPVTGQEQFIHVLVHDSGQPAPF